MFRKIFLIILPFIIISKAYSFEIPKLTSWVNDYAGIIDTVTAQELTSLLEQYEKQTTTQIFILTVNSFGDAGSIEEYSIKVAENWKPGQKGKDNGVLLVVAKQERKVRIEVGYGLEGSLTDLASSRIIRNIIIPQFKLGNFSGGIKAGVEGIIDAIGNKNFKYNSNYKRSISPHNKKWDSSGGSLFPVLFVLLPILFFLSMYSRIFRSLGSGLLFGGIAFSIFGLSIFVIFAIIIGFIIGLLFKSTGGFFGGGYGGGYSSGDSYSSSDFGSFSGGGGGDFGGGGSSGSW